MVVLPHKEGAGRRVPERLRLLLFDRRFLWLLLAINAGGAASGYLWYREQLASTPRYYWPFVPDSPLSATLFALMLGLWLAGRRGAFSRLVALVATVWIIKYGLWAVGLISDYWSVTARTTPVEWSLWLSHWGMALEGALYFPYLAVSRRTAAAATAWVALNDFIDYGLGQHPYLFLESQHPLALSLALGLSLGLSAAVWVRAARR
ncbi:MAG: DUF1405 domain-containing protein [Clostridia bacterium]|jgi:uncharacterized membrane protein YpjA|nr:DUF1405 domain-containing protein [Clostridia bacterium]MDH7572890.1 DUF1405 domain-containing protein [Clostridia bacterium]